MTLDRSHNPLHSIVRRQDGQTMAEYSVVVGVLVLGVIAAIGFFGVAVAGQIDRIVTAIGGAIS